MCFNCFLDSWKLRLKARTTATDMHTPLVIEAWSDSNFGDKADERARSHMGWNINYSQWSSGFVEVESADVHSKLDA